MTLITIDRPAIEQVLESLLELVPDPRTDFGPAYGGASQRRKKSISILRAALLVKHSAKQPAEQQEPVGYMNAGHVYELQQKRIPYGYVYQNGGTGAEVAIYTAPQPAKQEPLTREEIFELAKPFGEFQYGDAQGHKRIDFAHAIIAAYERKNISNSQPPTKEVP